MTISGLRREFTPKKTNLKNRKAGEGENADATDAKGNSIRCRSRGAAGFRTQRVAEVLAVLDEYGTAEWHREPDRVRLAILKLAAGSVERLRRELENAKCDYRDVLAPAEYPGYCKRVSGRAQVSPDEQQRIIDADWKQYQDWLTR